MKQKADNLIAQNKKASHDYFIKETLEAGIALTGTEIKSIRARRINLRDGYVQIINGSAFLENVHISEYKEEIVLSRKMFFLIQFTIVKLLLNL